MVKIGTLGKLLKAYRYIREFIDNFPWIRAATYLAGSVAGLFALNMNLPEELQVDLSSEEVQVSAWVILICSYFMLASIFSAARLREEMKLRELEQNYKYDNRGTLFNGKEANIAFRVVTFQKIFESISDGIDANKASALLKCAGNKASEDFSKEFVSIYEKDVLSKRGGKKWDDLTLSEKLNQWAEYDSATGWGMLTTKLSNDGKLSVVVTHLYGLYQGDGGSLFAWFLAGYIETIVSRIVDSHTGGRFHEYSKAEFSSMVDRDDAYVVNLEFSLK